MDLLSRIRTRGIVVVVDPMTRTYAYYRGTALSYPEDLSYIQVMEGDRIVEIFYLSDYGKKWFATKKEADRYCNSLLTSYFNSV